VVEALEKLGEGREAEVFAWSDHEVLRVIRDPDAVWAAEREAAALAAAGAAGCSVPRVGEVTTHDGRPALVMERIDGPDLLSHLARRPWKVFDVARSLGEIHADLHRVGAPSELPSLKEMLRLRIESAPGLSEDSRAFALAELDALPDSDALCHGDFHPGNILEGKGGPVVIDWINATRGDPDADVARTMLLLGVGRPPPGSSRMLTALAAVGRGLMRNRYMAVYQGRSGRKVAVERWVPVHAAARMSEGIVEEFPALIALLERAKGGATKGSASRP
jgi:aminoglycoside phosphotransferase (APT) family kinase protein